MLKSLIKLLATETSMTQVKARRVLGILLNSAERQGSPFAETLYQQLPGARTLAAKIGDELGTATGPIARLIEQTPGGRRHVAAEMISRLQAEGLGHEDIGRLLPAVARHAQDIYGLTGFGHLGDLIGADLNADAEAETAAA